MAAALDFDPLLGESGHRMGVVRSTMLTDPLLLRSPVGRSKPPFLPEVAHIVHGMRTQRVEGGVGQAISSWSTVADGPAPLPPVASFSTTSLPSSTLPAKPALVRTSASAFSVPNPAAAALAASAPIKFASSRPQPGGSAAEAMVWAVQEQSESGRFAHPNLLLRKSSLGRASPPFTSAAEKMVHGRKTVRTEFASDALSNWHPTTPVHPRARLLPALPAATVFGVRTKRDVSVGELITNRFQNEWLEHQHTTLGETAKQ